MQEQICVADYPASALRTEKRLPTDIERLEHAALGFITETGEIGTAVKRLTIYGKQLGVRMMEDATPSLLDNIVEESGDAWWYLPIACDVLGMEYAFRDLVELEPICRENLSRDERLKKIVFGLAAAAGRFANQVDMAKRHVGAIDNNLELRTSLHYIMQYLVDLSHTIGVPVAQVLGENIAKLRKRFPDAYSDVAAEARADKGGLDARNS